MKKRRAFAAFIAIAVVLSALFCSCAPKHKVTAKDTERLRELADILGADLNEKILPKKGDPDSLTDYDYVVSGKDYSKGTEALAIFFADYKAKKDCEITLILTYGNFVISRVAFIDGAGYYLRYEYNEENPKSFEIRGQTLTGVDLEYQKASSKESSQWIFKLNDGYKQRASFAIDG